jgi:ADP-heptose:LPS heptosyltransferase
MRKVAIIRRNGLGDLLCTFPLISYLKQQDPHTQIVLFVDETNAPLLEYLPTVDEIVVIKKSGNKYLDLISLALKYRYRKFDLAISAKTSPMKLMNTFLFALGAHQRAAYVDNHWTGKFINQPLTFDPLKSKGLHQALKVLHLVDPSIQQIPHQWYPRICPVAPIQDGRKVLISASTTRPASRLDMTRYASMVNRLYAENGPFEVLLLSLPADEIRAQAIAAELKVPYKLCFPRDFKSFMTTLANAHLVFCGDGGIGHLSAAFGTPSLVLFGETRPSEWAPLGDMVNTLYDPIHVNRISDEVIFKNLKEQMEKVK